MEKALATKKQVKILLVMVSLLLLLLIAFTIAYYRIYLKSHEEKELNYTTQMELLHSDLEQTYNLFKNNATSWNSSYAQLTLNHTRDSIEHSKYIVEDFAKMHGRLMGSLDYMVQYHQIRNGFLAYQLPHFLEPGYKTQHLMNTYEYRDKFFDQKEQLDDAFQTIVHNSKATDSVYSTYYFDSGKFNRYFRILNNMDKHYYNLLAYRYQEDLEYVTNTNPKLIKRAKENLLLTHVNELMNRHQAAKEEDYRYHNPVSICTSKDSDSLTTYISHVNGSKELLMVQTDRPIGQLKLQEQTDFMQEVLACAGIAEIENQNALYVYIRDLDWNVYVSRNSKTGFSPIDGFTERSLLSFYDDDYGRYYVTDRYEAFKVFYPNEVDPHSNEASDDNSNE